MKVKHTRRYAMLASPTDPLRFGRNISSSQSLEELVFVAKVTVSLEIWPRNPRGGTGVPKKTIMFEFFYKYFSYKQDLKSFDTCSLIVLYATNASFVWFATLHYLPPLSNFAKKIYF